jgi:hypothetical protein
MQHLNQYGYDHVKFMARVSSLETKTKIAAHNLFEQSKREGKRNWNETFRNSMLEKTFKTNQDEYPVTYAKDLREILNKD